MRVIAPVEVLYGSAALRDSPAPPGEAEKNSRPPIFSPVKKSKKYRVIKMAAQHGGFRKGAGRPKGSRNRATIAREARQREALATARAENANLSAIDYLLQVLRDRTTPPGRRTQVAKFVAPYLEYRVRVSRSRRGQAKSKT